ncbi:MAG: hypothetical protein M3Q97_00490, partial [Bacteroidota bacterium]|nr:hypothetical protein [Bacteroidota bacterium]
SEDDKEQLKVFCVKYAANCALDTSVWYYFDNITKEIPLIESYSPSHFVRNNGYVELKDSAHVYMVRIIDHRLKDDISPYSLEKTRIREILRNQKQVQYLKEKEKELFQDGIASKNIRISQP